VSLISTMAAFIGENAPPRSTHTMRMFHKQYRGCAVAIIAAFSGATALAQTGSADTHVLSTTVIRGSTAYTPVELFPAYRDQLGLEINRDNARAIVAALEKMYARDGYSAPEMQLDGKLADRGILHIDVYEPQITRVALKGDVGPYGARLEQLTTQLRESQPVKRTDVQRTLQSMRELPGLTISAATHRDESRRNAYSMDIEAQYKPADGVLRLTNRGTSEVGPQFVTGQVGANSLLGLNEKLGLLFASAFDVEEYHGGGLFADVPVGAKGTRVFTMAFASTSNPTEEGGDLNDDYTRERFTLRITRPVFATSRVNVSLGGVLDLENLGIDRDGERLREDRLRAVELGGRVSWRGSEKTQYLATVDLRQGLEGLGSGLFAPDLIDDPRRTDFLLARLQFVRLTRLNENWSVRADALAQHSSYILPYSERFKIGGERIGRGFEVTEVAGDQGAGAKLELRRELAPAFKWFGKTSAYGFYDIGAVWTQDGPRERESVATAGFGVSMTGERLNGYLEIAQPLTHVDVEGSDSATLFAEISLKY
jgi:hemolysin activation/secretion protein